jgi:hypothetical protein
MCGMMGVEAIGVGEGCVCFYMRQATCPLVDQGNARWGTLASKDIRNPGPTHCPHVEARCLLPVFKKWMTDTMRYNALHLPTKVS